MDKNTQKFEDLIKKDKYSVFILACPTYIPFSFTKHPWFVLNKKGVISRWEVRHTQGKNNSHLFFNSQPPFQGIQLTFFLKKHFWKPKLIGFIEGDEGSTAQKIIEFIENEENTYPYRYRYSFFGPNSNTYIQWVLNKFPEFKVKLSWDFIGKGFKIE